MSENPCVKWQDLRYYSLADELCGHCKTVTLPLNSLFVTCILPD